MVTPCSAALAPTQSLTYELMASLPPHMNQLTVWPFASSRTACHSAETSPSCALTGTATVKRLPASSPATVSWTERFWIPTIDSSYLLGRSTGT